MYFYNLKGRKDPRCGCKVQIGRWVGEAHAELFTCDFQEDEESLRGEREPPRPVKTCLMWDVVMPGEVSSIAANILGASPVFLMSRQNPRCPSSLPLATSSQGILLGAHLSLIL